MFIWTCIAAASLTLPSADKGPDASEADESPFQMLKLTGQVVPFREAIEKRLGVRLEGKEADQLLALETEDGRLLTILPTTSSRIFYLDPQMQRRPVRVTARVYEQSDGLQVIDVHTLKDGKLFEVYYWCGICSIKSYARRPCECCQEPVELREEPIADE